MQAWILSSSAWVGGWIRRATSIRSPPAWILATIFGTLPSWCTAWRSRPDETAPTSPSAAISCAWLSRERQLRAGEEEVVDEVVAGLAELREVGHDRAVRLDEVAAGAGEHPLLGHLACDGQVGADPGERVERRLLRALEPVREARDRDHEADAEREPGERDDRPTLAPEQLGAEVAQVEHGRS